jgi:hypothetical protein
MSTSTMHADGRARKSLAEQIDRLDRILDGLADGLNEAVADAVTQAVSRAVKEAIQGVLTEVLSNPNLRAKLQSSAVAPADTPVAGAPPARSIANWIGTKVTRFVGWCSDRLRRLGQVCRRIVQEVQWGATDLKGRVSGLRFLVLPLVAALVLGVATGVAAYSAGPWLAGVVGGTGSFSLRLALSVRRLLRPLWDSPVLAPVRAALPGLGRWGVV